MLDIGKLDCIQLFKAFGGTGSTGRLRVFVLPDLDTDNPYDLPEVITPTLLLNTECVSMKLQTKGMASEADPSGVVNYSYWKCTIDGSIPPTKLRLGAYAVIDRWNNQVIKGIVDQIDRKHSNRYRLTIDTAQNVPFEVVDEVIELNPTEVLEVLADASNS
jgi:hypothetical protein